MKWNGPDPKGTCTLGSPALLHSSTATQRNRHFKSPPSTTNQSIATYALFFLFHFHRLAVLGSFHFFHFSLPKFPSLLTNRYPYFASTRHESRVVSSLPDDDSIPGWITSLSEGSPFFLTRDQRVDLPLWFQYIVFFFFFPLRYWPSFCWPAGFY